MEKIRISSKNKFINDAIALYETAFPQNERRETDELIRLIDNCPEFHFNVFADGEQFIGFFSTWEWPDFRYGEHFAVCPSHRGGGIGTQILKSIADADNRPMIIEVEPPFDDIARRRIEFYRRNGFRLWDSIRYVQPPYSEGRDAIELKLMTFGDIELTENDDKIRRIHKEVYGKE